MTSDRSEFIGDVVASMVELGELLERLRAAGVDPTPYMVGAVKRPPAVGDDDLSRLVRVWADIWGRRREEDSELVLEVIRILTSESPPEAQVSKVTDPVTFMTVPRSRPG